MLIELIFGILLIVVFGKLIVLAAKMTWGITKIVFSIIIFPLVLIGLVFAGLMYLALPILIIVGIVSFISSAK